MYTDLTRIQSAIRESDLISLTDPKGTGEVGEDIVNTKITDVGEVIDGYLRGRYPVPLNPVPGNIRKFATDMVVYELATLSQLINDEYRTRNADAIRFLEGVASGRFPLDQQSPAQTEMTAIHSNRRVFGRNRRMAW